MVNLTFKKIAKISMLCIASLLACSWSSVTSLSDPGSYDPTVSVNGNGEAIVAWNTQDSNNIFVQTAYYDGMYWYAYETLDSFGYNVNPAVAIDDDGNAIIVWEIFDYSNGNRYIASSTRPSGDEWGTPEIISIGDMNSFSAIAINASGQVIAGWINSQTDRIEIATQTFGDGWSTVSTITPAGGYKGNLNLGISADGNCVAAWEEFEDGTIHVMNTTSGFASAWSAQKVYSDTGAYTSPSLSVAANGDAVVSWVDNATFNIYAALYLSGDWDEDQTLLSNDFSYYPVSAAATGGFFVSWMNVSSGLNQSIRYASGAWDTPVDEAVDFANSPPAISAATASSHTAWTNYFNSTIEAVDFDLTGSPSAPVVISISELNVNPVLASSAAITVAAWTAFNGIDQTIEANID